MLSMSRGTAAHGDSLMRTRSVRLAAEAERGAEGGATAVGGGEEVAVRGRGLMGGGAVARIAVHVPSAYLSGYHRQRPKGGRRLRDRSRSRLNTGKGSDTCRNPHSCI